MPKYFKSHAPLREHAPGMEFCKQEQPKHQQLLLILCLVMQHKHYLDSVAVCSLVEMKKLRIATLK